MKLIKTRNDLVSVVDGNGVVQEPVKVQKGASLIQCDFLTSFKNIHSDGKFSINGLSGFVSLNGQSTPYGGVLSGLINVVELNDFRPGPLTQLAGLNKLASIGHRFRPAAKGSISGLTSLKSISSEIMWPSGYVLKDVDPELIKKLPDWLRRRLNFL
jgi:hypothetical protein